MDLKTIFINSAGRLRSGWRLLVFTLLFLLLMFVIGTVVRFAYAVSLNLAPNRSWGFYIQDIVFRSSFLLSALLAGWIGARWLEGLPWKSLGLTFHSSWLRDLLVGSGIGIVSLALAAGIAAAAGGLSFIIPGRSHLIDVVKTLVFSGALFIVAALAEEALFRGYPLQTLSRAGLIVLGVLLTSVPFAAIHLGNPNSRGVLPFINTALAGIWLAVAYLRTRSLWFPLGVHWAWNWALGSLFGLPVSGMDNLAPNPLLRGVDFGPAWLTGGTYGIEGGLACTLALALSTVFIWRFGLVSATPELLQVTSHENPIRTVAMPVKTGTSASVSENTLRSRPTE